MASQVKTWKESAKVQAELTSLLMTTKPERIICAVNTFDQAREALEDACLTYAVHGDQPPQKWLDALAAMEDEPA